ncbi:MAG: DUF4402 domain-containing protein [Balneolaceae bacterium]
MTRALFILFLLVVSSSNYLFAQDASQSVKANIDIRATIVSSIELITVNSIRVGNLQAGQDEIYINSLNDINAGYMIAVGAPGAAFRLNYERSRVLTQAKGNGTLIFEYELSGNNIEEQTTATSIIDEDVRNLQFNEEGRYHIWVGGRINLRNALPGSYDGDFTIEIEYI